MSSHKVHPTAVLIKTHVIDDPDFSFNHISCLDYPWVMDCNGYFPQKGKGCSDISYFFWRDYYDPMPYEDWPDDYAVSWWRNFVLDGTTMYNYPVDEIPIEVLRPDDETSTDFHRRLLEYRKSRCIWGLRNCHCNQTGVHCLRDENMNPELYWTDYGNDDEYDSDETGEEYKTEIRSISTYAENTLAYRMNALGPDSDSD